MFTLKAENLRAAAYPRFSSDMQRSESIDAQLRAIKKYAKDNNYVIVGEYLDLAKSGKNDNRPEFQNMIFDAKQKKFDLVIVHKLDRFARNRYDSVRYRHELKRKNIKLLSVLENYDSESPEGVLMESLYEGMNEYYIRNLSREIMKGLKENAYKAKFTGGKPPLGYDIDEDLNYIINQKEAECVKIIFEMVLAGKGYLKIIDHLNQLGYRTKRGNLFGKNSLYDILKNPKYAGIYQFNAAQSRDVDGRRNSHAQKSNDEIIRIENAIPAIITKEQFDKVQEIKEKHKHTSGSNTAKEIYLLTGKIVCGECGNAYVGTRKFNAEKKKYVFYCCGRKQRTTDCTSHAIRREAIEAYVLEQISDFIFDEALISKLVSEYEAYLMDNNSNAKVWKQQLVKQLQAKHKEITNITSLMAKTGSPALIDKLEELENEKVLIESSISNIQQDFKDAVTYKHDVIDAFNTAKKLFMQGTLATTKQLINLLVDKIIIYDDYVELRLKLMDGIMPNDFSQNKKPTQSRVSVSGAEGGVPDTLTRNDDYCDSCMRSQRIKNVLRILHDEVRIKKQFPYLIDAKL